MRVRLLVFALLVSACLAITGPGPQKPRATTLVAAADDNALKLQSSSDVPASVFNLAKTILGAGILSLPSGVAAFTDDAGGLWPASGLLVVMGLISAYSFASIGRACRLHDVRTFSDAWGKSVGPKSAVVISSVITLKTFFSCLAFSIIIGDSFSSIFKSFGLPAVLTTRTNVILGLTSLVIFPLCLLKNLDALKTTSIMGLGGIVYCALFMAVRLVDGSYRGPNGRFFKDISDAVKPSFNQRVTTAAASSSHAIFVLISMLSTAFVAHYNAPKFWAELKNKTAQRYHTVIASAFGFAAAMYLSVMWTGFLTFGGHSTGFILNNYSGKDAFATVARICIGLAILFGYPLVFSALREGLFDLLRLPAVGDARAKHNVPATAVLMALITALALKLTNLGLVVSLSGALIGAMLIYFVPAVMNICNIKKEAADATTKVKGGNKTAATVRYTREQHTELLANYAMGLMGILIAVNGVATTLMSAGGGAH